MKASVSLRMLACGLYRCRAYIMALAMLVHDNLGAGTPGNHFVYMTFIIFERR